MSRLEDLKREATWRKYCRDAQAFMEDCVWIQHPRGRRLIELRQAQLETLGDIQRHDKVVILKARQIGFTTLLGAYVLWLSITRPEQNIILLSRTERDAQDFLQKIKYAWNGLPDWVKTRAPNLTSGTLQKMAWDNGSVVESLPSQDDPARGRTVTLVIVDEWASLENQDEAWASILPIVDIGGKFIGLSTAKGWGNLFHTVYVEAKAGINGFKHIFHAWWSVPERDEEWYEQKRREFPMDWQIHQEFPSNDDEAFIKSGNAVFDIGTMQRLEKDCVEPRVGELRVSTSHGYDFVPNQGGYLRVFKNPEAGRRYAVGADVAVGYDYGDYSSAHVIDCKTGEVCAVWHGWLDTDLFGDDLNALGRWYNQALVGVEENGPGLSVLNTLRRNRYPRIFYRRQEDDRTKRTTSKIGWYSSRITKPLMINDLNASLREGEVVLRDAETFMELKTYVRDEKGGMGGSPHDDRVTSLAIANQMRLHVFSPEYVESQGPAPNTFDWHVQQILAEKGADGSAAIGRYNVRRFPR